jgi:integrase/recombinase XerD
MSNKSFWSVYASHLSNFIGLKRSLGYKYKKEERLLHTFDRFLLNQDYTAPFFTKELLDKWIEKDPNQAERTHYDKVKVVKQFATYLHDIGIKTYIPPLPKCPKTFIPYIYSPDEINAIFRACDSLRMKCRNVYSCLLIMPCLIRMLFGTGIRISEALSLKNKDVDITGGCLTLRDTKNGKDRLVPISASLAQVCKDYLEYRGRLPVAYLELDDHPFFVSLNGEVCKHDSVYRWFRDVLEIAEIPFNGNRKGPRIHDARHSFACYSFVKLSDEGMDMYCSWPYLSTYLGHQSLAATEQYLRLTSNMYPELLKDADGVSIDVLPNLNLPAKTKG